MDKIIPDRKDLNDGKKIIGIILWTKRKTASSQIYFHLALSCDAT